MMEHVHEWMHIAASIVGVIGVAVLLWGVGVGGVYLVRMEACRFTGRPLDRPRGALRKTLAFYLLLGLEFLVAADIIETIIKPDLDALLVLGLVVVIRTIISFSLNWELTQEAKLERALESGDG